MPWLPVAEARLQAVVPWVRGALAATAKGSDICPCPFLGEAPCPIAALCDRASDGCGTHSYPPHTKKMQRAEVGPTIIITTTAAAARAATAKQQQQQTQQQQQQQQLQQPLRLILSSWARIYVLAQVPCPVSQHSHVLSRPMCWPMCFLDPHLARPVVQHVP